MSNQPCLIKTAKYKKGEFLEKRPFRLINPLKSRNWENQ